MLWCACPASAACAFINTSHTWTPDASSAFCDILPTIVAVGSGLLPIGKDARGSPRCRTVARVAAPGCDLPISDEEWTFDQIGAAALVLVARLAEWSTH